LRWGKTRVVFYANHGEHPLTQQLDDAGIPWEHLSGSIRSLLSALSRRPKLLHTHGYKAGILGRMAAFFCHTPVVSTFHAGEPGKGMVRLYNLLDGLTANFGEAIAVSAKIRKRIHGHAHFVRNFVPVPVHSTNANSNTIVFVGRLSHEKGPDFFCQMAELLPSAKFEVFGDGPMREELEKMYGKRVLFHGQVNNMEAHWPNIGMVCMPSRHEGLPYAALEAMGHGVSVAAFDVGGLAKLIEHGRSGWIAPQGDVKLLSDHISCWLEMDTQTRAEMSSAAHRAVKDRFSPDVIIPLVVAIYKKALSDKGCLDTPISQGGEPC